MQMSCLGMAARAAVSTQIQIWPHAGTETAQHVLLFIVKHDQGMPQQGLLLMPAQHACIELIGQQGFLTRAEPG